MLVKALVVQYGPNLELLKHKTGVDVLELILRQHKIHVQGSRYAYERLIRFISDKAKEVYNFYIFTRNVWSMKWRVPGQEETKENLERDCGKRL